MVFDGKFEVEFLLEEGDDEKGRGWSFASKRRVSAATIPPIEWPSKTVCTDGSTVGDGVECATSMSITRF